MKGMQLRGKSRGAGAIEAIIALGILGLVAVAFIGGLSTTLKAVSVADEQSTAQAIAQSEMEYVKSLPYEYGTTGYGTDPNLALNGYAFAAVAAPLHDPDDGIQKVMVTVKHHDKEVLTLEDYKVDR